MEAFRSFLHLWFLNFTKICLDVGFSLLFYLALYKSFQSQVFHFLFKFLQIFLSLCFFLSGLEFHHFNISISVYLNILSLSLEISIFFWWLLGEFLNMIFWFIYSVFRVILPAIHLFHLFKLYSNTRFLFIHMTYFIFSAFVENIYYAYLKILVHLSQLSCFMGCVVLSLFSFFKVVSFLKVKWFWPVNSRSLGNTVTLSVTCSGGSSKILIGELGESSWWI